MFTTGDKLLNMMKEEEVSIMELSRMSGVPERTIMDILAGIREPELSRERRHIRYCMNIYCQEL